MFLTSSAKPIDENLRKIVDEIEAQSSSLSVLAARKFRYSCYQTPVEVNIKEARQFNVLEEFLLRTGIEFDTPISADELASILGLDSVFVQSTVTTLQSLQVLAVTSKITVTAEGRLFYQQGTVPKPPYPKTIYAIDDPLEEKLIFQYEPLKSLDDGLKNLPDLENFVNDAYKINDIALLSIEELQKIIRASSLALHIPEEGKIIDSFKVISATQKTWKDISLFVIFDANNDKLSIQVRSENKILSSASSKLQSLQEEDKILLESLCQLSDDIINFERQVTLNRKNAEIEARLEKIRQKALENSTKTILEQDKPASGTAIQLRDRQIAQAFWEVLKSAKHQVLIYSPWVSHAVVDEEFLKLLQELVERGVWILIGHGIARRQEDEDRPIPAEIEAKLQGIKTLDGLPGVQIFWLGDSHVKEVIVDQEIHLCGSHNWLSYRGDYLPRGESVYKVTIPHQVQEAYEFLSHRFQNHAQKLWQNALEVRDPQIAINPLCVWGSLGMENVARKKIEDNNWSELLPVLLKIKAQSEKRNSK